VRQSFAEINVSSEVLGSKGDILDSYNMLKFIGDYLKSRMNGEKSGRKAA